MKAYTITILWMKEWEKDRYILLEIIPADRYGLMLKSPDRSTASLLSDLQMDFPDWESQEFVEKYADGERYLFPKVPLTDERASHYGWIEPKS